MDPTVAEPTVQQLADFLQWNIEAGRGAWKLRLCPRGLSMWRKGDDDISLSVPHFGHTHDEKTKTVFVRAVF